MGLKMYCEIGRSDRATTRARPRWEAWHRIELALQVQGATPRAIERSEI